MMEEIRRWLFSLVALSLLIALVQTLTPRGTMRRICGFTGGLALLLCVLRPLSGALPEQSVEAFSTYRAQRHEITEQYIVENERALEMIIAEQTASYILDKAAQLRLDCEVEVTARTTDGIALPYSVTIIGAYSETLAGHIERTLSIPRERQTWRTP